MSRIHQIAVASVVMVAAGWAAPAQASHVCREYHHEQFHAANRQLNQELHHRNRVLHDEVQQVRECIHADLRHAHKHLRGHARTETVRQLHEQLNDVNRQFHRRVRDLHEEIADRRQCLQRDLQVALRSCRTASCGPACTGVTHAVPHPRAGGFGGVHDHSHGSTAPFPYDPYEQPHRGANWHAERSEQHRSEFDWQGLVLELLARRRGR